MHSSGCLKDVCESVKECVREKSHEFSSAVLYYVLGGALKVYYFPKRHSPRPFLLDQKPSRKWQRCCGPSSDRTLLETLHTKVRRGSVKVLRTSY
jgi:hypothetical protein